MVKISGALDMRKVGSTVVHQISSHVPRRYQEGLYRRCYISLHGISPLNAWTSSQGGLVYIGYLLLSNTN